MKMKWEPTAFKSDLGRARGLGSAHTGVHHWVHQRLTAIALMALMIWFADGILYLSHVSPDRSYEAALRWVGGGLNPVIMAILIIATFYHAALGLRVVIEDYVHNEGGKFAILMATNFTLFFCAALSLYAIFKSATFLTALQTALQIG